ncbi:uncharacterized protein [Heterodontus francisci]|uniref:uncharacterized protein isoform X2 n=1 Tax=Heterodontus francisci TaxID=7792 RepID=UPI00355B8CCC
MKLRVENMSSSPPSPSCNQPCSPSWNAVSRSEIFQTVSLASGQFTQEILPILQQAFLDSSSGSYFQYNQVTLVNNTKLLDQYNACRQDMEGKGYSKEELAECFAFLLFETEDQAKSVCQKGLQIGSSNITTLGDPLKGVYLCKYSDFLHPTPWYHGKCGYILIFKILKGRVKSMIENYTADLTSPSVGYNCHVSINSDTVSSITSHFQAFELTQYYVYEFGQCHVLQCPRQIYPYAIVAFQYCDNKCIMTRSAEIDILVPEIQAVEYYPWKGQLINKDKVISVALKSNGSPLMPVILPTKLKIEYIMNIGELKHKLPRAVFERKNYKLKEVCLEGFYCSWYELVEYTEGKAPQLGPLIDEMREKNLAIVKCLNDQGLLILFTDSVSSSTRGSSKSIHNVVQAVFIFKAPRISHLKEINRVTRTQGSSLFKNRITPLLPGIGYAVTKALKSPGAPVIPRNKLVEDHLVEYFKMTPELSTSSNVTADRGPPITARAALNKGEPLIPGDCQRTTISQLSPYFTDPASYILPVSTILKLQEKCLKLCLNSGARHKVLCHSHALEPKPPNAALPREKRISKPRMVQGKDSVPMSLPAVSTPPWHGMKCRATARSQTNGELCKTVGRANPVSTPTLSMAVSKGANKVKKKAARPLLASVSNKLGAKAQMLGTFRSLSCAASSGAASAASKSQGCSTRSQSARNNKRTLVQSGKGISTEPPTPTHMNKKKIKAAGVPSTMDSKRGSATGKAVGSCKGTEKIATEKLTKQRGQTVCVTGVNTEQVTRYGVCTWNIVENAFVDDEPASLHPPSSGTGSSRLSAKKTPEMASPVSQEGVETNIGETDALNILADLAISSSITAVAKPKQKYTMVSHQASGMSASNKTGSVGNSRQLNHCPNLLANRSDCSPNRELWVQNIMPFVAESHQEGSSEFSESQPSNSAASRSLASLSCVASAFSNRKTSHVRNSHTRVPKELAHRSLTTPHSSRALGDHSYSRPPRDREPTCLAVANPVLSEKETEVCQYTSLHAERYPAALHVQNTIHTSLSQPEVGSKDEERTLVGRVLPFRREDTCWTNVTNSTPDPQKNNIAMGKYGQRADYTLADSTQSRFDEEFQQSRSIHEEKDTVIVTFQWKGPYLFQWDSKYTNDSLEKSVNRALHGPWDPTVQETMKEVKLILHMWIGLFYTKSSMMLQTSMRQVQEHTETPDPAAAGGDLHEELARVGEAAFSESGSESATSEKLQTAGVIISSVIKRIEKKSNLVTSCDTNIPFGRETLPCASSQPEVECPLDSDCAIINDTKDPEPQNSSGGLTLTAHIAAEEDCEQESTNDFCAARLENESQEQNLNQRLTPLSVESQSSSAQPSTCPFSVADESRSANNVDDLVIENGQVGIIRQSSVIREVFGIQLPVQEPSQSEENTNSSNVGASGSCQKPIDSNENRLQTKWFDHPTASEDIENTSCTEDLGTIKDTFATERHVPQDKLGGVNLVDAALQSFPFAKDVLSNNNTVNTSESSNVITYNYSRSLGSSNPLDNTAGPLVQGSTCSYVENRTDIQLLRDGTETHRKTTSVEKMLGWVEITSNSDPEFPDKLKCMSPGDECRSQIKLQAISSQNCVENQSVLQKQKEFKMVNHGNNFNTASEKSNCGREVSKESAFTPGDLSEGSVIEIQTDARDFSENKKVPRISLNGSSRKRKRKRKAYREKLQCLSDTDSEHGNFREKWSTGSGHLQMRNVDLNYFPHGFEENNMVEEMSDSDAPAPPVIKILDPFGRLNVYQNFTVTAEAQQKPDRPFTSERTTRTFCNWQKKCFSTSAVQYLGQWNWNARCSSNISPIQKILDLEYINFSRNLNHLVNRANTAPYTSFVSSSRDGNKTALRRKNIQRVSSGRVIGRRNPLTVTISCQKTNQSNGGRLYNETQKPHWTNREDATWQQEGFAFYKPKNYANFMNSHKRLSSQIHVMSCHSVEPADRVPSKQHCTGEKGSLFADELLNVKHKEYEELQGDGRKRTDPFLCLVSELCSDLHQNLNEVVKESWKGTYKFYVSETNSDPFFKEIKEFLRKEGHEEIGPLDLSMIQPPHSGRVLIVIRNEDISAHLHQIPHLVALKQRHCVQFAGVDNPGDIKDQTFQELLSSGGFVVSDGTVLNDVTPEHLQQISAVLEQLNMECKWKWMIHFKELKKLKEVAREDNTAKRKISLLTRKIAANIVEVLPFHECDSSSQEKPDYLRCLVKLQVQKISSRFAVFLTGQPENREIFAQSGILVTDVKNFTKGLRMLTTPLQSSLATENAVLAESGHSTETQLESSFGKSTVTQNLQMTPTLF